MGVETSSEVLSLSSIVTRSRTLAREEYATLEYILQGLLWAGARKFGSYIC